MQLHDYFILVSVFPPSLVLFYLLLVFFIPFFFLFFIFYLICVSDLNFESERKTKYVNSKSLHMLIMAKVPRLPNEL